MNVIALDVDINTMRDVPYLSFGEDGGKEIYAFVDDCQYTNERRTLVYYTITNGRHICLISNGIP
jgi:hypothetical protein